MKTYEQMAHTVLQKIDEENKKKAYRRQQIFRASVAVCCAVLTVLAGVGVSHFGKDKQTSPSNGITKPIATSVLQVAYLSENGCQRSVMKEHIETQMRYNLSVIDTRGLTTSQREALREEKVEQLERAITDNYQEFNNCGGSVNSAWDNVLFILLHGGSFELDHGEGKTVENIYAECSSVYGEVEFGIHSKYLIDKKIVYQARWNGNETEQRVEKETRHGNVFLHAKSIKLDGATYDRVRTDGAFYIRWKPTSKLYEVLNQDPNKALSDFSDQMTIIVNYTDGTADTHRIDMVFHDDGNIGAVYQGVVFENSPAS